MRRQPCALVVAAALALGLGLGSTLAGCGDDSLRGPASGNDFRPTDDGVLTVATADIPTSGFWEGSANAPTGGFEYKLARRLAREFGLRGVKVVEVDFQRLVDDGDLGGADLALAQVTPTPERGEHLDFSQSYLPAPPGVLVRRGTDVPDAHTAKRLQWVVQRGTTLESALDDQVRPHDDPRVVDGQQDVVDTRRLRQCGRRPARPAHRPGRRRRLGRPVEVAGRLPGDEVLAAALPDGVDQRRGGRLRDPVAAGRRHTRRPGPAVAGAGDQGRHARRAGGAHQCLRLSTPARACSGSGG